MTDDMSEDNTRAILKSYSEQDSRIKVFFMDQNGGPGIARNNSIKNASGRYMAFLDSDDSWDSEKLERQISFMEEKDAALSYTSYRLIDESGTPVKRVIAKKEVGMKNMLRSNYIGCSTAIYDTLKLGKVYMPVVRKRQDYGLWLDIIRKTEVAYGLEDDLTDYNLRKGSLSSNKLKVVRHQWTFYRKVADLNIRQACLSMLFWFFYSVMGVKNRGEG